MSIPRPESLGIVDVVKILRTLFSWYDAEGRPRYPSLLTVKRLAEHYRRAPMSLRPRVLADLIATTVNCGEQVGILFRHLPEDQACQYPVGVEFYFDRRCFGSVSWDPCDDYPDLPDLIEVIQNCDLDRICPTTEW
jgi:hypothetical protein